MDFAFKTKKGKHKTISFCLVRSWKSYGFPRRTNHSRTVVRHYDKIAKQMNRIEFIKFLEEFKKDFDENQSAWENTNLSDFLESMIAYTQDIQGYYDNMKMDVDADKPTWENFRNILMGASIYE